jgi:hypothetical protein|tara:strand:- start:230 stop:481 length:252 start_codon:yes stop_codon:yes gene_type:complete
MVKSSRSYDMQKMPPFTFKKVLNVNKLVGYRILDSGGVIATVKTAAERDTMLRQLRAKYGTRAEKKTAYEWKKIWDAERAKRK